MVKTNYYDLRQRGTTDIHNKFLKDLEELNKIDPKIYFHFIGMKYGLSKKFVLEILTNMAEIYGLKEENGFFIRGDF